ncbi:SMP-30/gluconolactonase/LRE family protein [Rhabdobacter roseus]|uniref:Sugar lactone lactonase YvrE n=1 Tax=Rhabdobacter roseus TaxID=1655419 RepID=A0A840TQV4_9BACT|nr:SMP-30/gluconolactonase/LRE family protein [Rhabdobacter roseus]MBB5285295.1 sugar lactone lactonase YvrE [Rhabdobacter roseus]
MKKYQAEVALELEATLGEGPLWHPEEQKLYWVDIEQQKVHQYDPERQTHQHWKLPKKVSALVPGAQPGTLVVALQGEIASFDPATEALTALVDVEKDKPANRCNDGKCAPDGRLWVGTMSTESEDKAGALYCLDGALQLRLVRDHCTIPNGMAWTTDGRTMYFIETSESCVRAFDYDSEKGTLTNERVVVKPEEGGSPDGMCIDAEGKLWIGFWDGQRVGCYDPQTGQLLAEVEVPAVNVTSCAFGDADLGTLYITTARDGVSDEQLEKYPLTGSLFRCRPGVKGTLADSFAL